MVAVNLFVIVGIMTFFYAAIITLITGHANHYFLNLAFGIDQLGNVLIAPIANRLLIKSGGYLFGHLDETISSALGKNKLDQKLTAMGRSICSVLDWIDPNHCIKSIDNSIIWK